MTEDDLLTRIGAHAREEQKDDARFERVARGEADEADLADLERAASGDPELAMRLDGSRPLDEDAVDRIAARATAVRTKPNEPRKATMTRAAAPEKGTNLSPLRRGSWTRRVVIAAGPFAAAAAMILYVIAGPSVGPSGPELPSYTVTATGEQAMRGPAPDPSPRLHLSKGRDARFEIVLRPATAPATKIVAYAFAMMGPVDGAEVNPLDAKIEIAPEGGVRITGPSRLLEGAREIRIVIGAPAAIGKFDDAAAHAKGGKGNAQVHVVTVPIDRG